MRARHLLTAVAVAGMVGCGATAPPQDDAVRTLPRNAGPQLVVLVLDQSGSMTGDKIDLAAEGARRFREVLPLDDLVGIVGFDAHTRVLLEPTPVRDRAAFDEAMKEYRPQGGTDIHPALMTAYMLVTKHSGPAHVVLLTDGNSAHHGIRELVRSMRARSVTLSTLAFGEDADDAFLTDLARLGSGRHYRTTAPEELPSFMEREAKVIRSETSNP